MTEVALSVLSERMAAVWSKEREKLIREYCLYPDWFHASRSQELEKYMFFYQNEKREFHYLPRETVIGNKKRCTAAFIFLLKKIALNLKKNEISKAAKYAGVLAHFFEDSAGCQHSLEGPMGFNIPFGVPYPLVMQLFPAPVEKRYVPAQMILSQLKEPELSITGYKPLLLGASPTEAAFHLYERYWDVLRTSRANVVRVINGFYSDNNEEMNGALKVMLKEGARVIADSFYTAICLGKGYFESEAVKKLQEVHLENLTPLYRPWYTPMPKVYGHNCLIKNCNLNENFQPVPLTLLMKKDKESTQVTFKNGLGTGGGFDFKKDQGFNYKIGYDIPRGIFSQFKVIAGLNALLKNEGRFNLQIHWNGEIAYSTGVISGEELANEAIVDVSKGGILDLVFRKIGSGYPEVHVVWGNPALIRSRNAPIWR